VILGFASLVNNIFYVILSLINNTFDVILGLPAKKITHFMKFEFEGNLFKDYEKCE